MTNDVDDGHPSVIWDDFSLPREAVFVFDVSDRTQVEIRGTDRAKFLHGFCTSDIKRLEPGSGCETFLTNIKGRVVGHPFVFATHTSLWLDAVPGQSRTIIEHLDRYVIREDVDFADHFADRGELLLTGTLAAELLMIQSDLPIFGSVSRESNGQSFDVRRVDLFSRPGYLISLPRGYVAAMKQSLLSIGCLSGSSDLFESLRIATGFPQFGVDFSSETIAQEVARTSKCISFTKGCYLGQEPIARLDALGHTNRELRRIRFLSGIQPQSGSTIFAEGTSEDAGVITSIAPLQTVAGETLAIGCLKTKYKQTGTRVRTGNPSSITHGIVLE